MGGRGEQIEQLEPAGPTGPPAEHASVSIGGRIVPYRNVVAMVFVAALFLDILDSTIVNVAIPTIGHEFDTEAVEWVALGYTLSLAVWIPASGWLGDRVGTKRVFMGALVVFIVCSAACGAAQSFGQLVLFRLLQGVGGGMLAPVGTAMMFRAYPPAQRARAATWLMIPTLVAPATGPVLGGLLTETIGWRWIFYVNVPIGLVVIAFGFRYLREHVEPSAGAFDLPGFILSGAGFAAIVYSLSEGPRLGWLSASILVPGALGALAFVALVVVETSAAAPMLALRLLRDRLFRATNIVTALGSAGFIALLFLLPLYLQNLRGLSALQSGLATFPQAVGLLISTQIGGRLYGRVGPRRLIAFGQLVTGLATLAFVTVDTDTDLLWIQLLMFGRGLGVGFAFLSAQAASYARIAPADNGRASAIFNTQRQMAISLGIAIVATVLVAFTPITGRPPDGQRAMDGYRVAFATAAALSVLSAVAAALLVKDEDAAETMRKPRPVAVD